MKGRESSSTQKESLFRAAPAVIVRSLTWEPPKYEEPAAGSHYPSSCSPEKKSAYLFHNEAKSEGFLLPMVNIVVWQARSSRRNTSLEEFLKAQLNWMVWWYGTRKYFPCPFSLVLGKVSLSAVLSALDGNGFMKTIHDNIVLKSSYCNSLASQNLVEPSAYPRLASTF